jgi:dTDP-4-amino-4,6-dideoxygalactose transaminase
MALTNDPELARRMELLRSHGITRDARRFRAGDPAAWHYEQQALGFNYRLTDIQAALGTSQLGRLDEYVERRNALARAYDSALKDLPLQLPVVQAENRSAFHLYVIRLKLDRIRRTHRQAFDHMRSRGIAVNLHYAPVHLQPYYRDLGFAEGQQPEAEAYGASAMTLPLYPGLTDLEQQTVITTLAGAL